MSISVGQVATASDVNVALGLRSQYAWGTYSGNGATGRQITTGFLCGEVTLRDSTIWFESHDASAGVIMNLNSSSVATSSQVMLHGTNGFIVSMPSANSSTNSYSYMAFSRQ